MKSERIKQVYEEIGNHIVELDRDPSARGPKYLQDLIAQCRGRQNSVSCLLHEVHLEQHYLEMALRANRAAFQVSSDEMLTSDKKVMHLPSIDDRNAMINTLLREDLAAMKVIEHDLQDLGFVEKAIKHRAKELAETMSAIRLQRSLMRDEIDTGSMYGDETRNSRNKGGDPKDPDLDDFNDSDYKELLEGIESESEGGDADDAEVVEDEAPEVVEDSPKPADEEVVEDEEEVVEDEDDSAEAGSGGDEKIVFEDDESPASEGTPQDVGEAKATDNDIKAFLDEDDFGDLFEGLEDGDEV